MALVNNVNHKNMIVMWRYLKGFAKEHNLSLSDIDIFYHLNLPYPGTYKSAIHYYTDPREWSPLATYVKCYLAVKDITKDPNTYRMCGRSAAKYKSFEQVGTICKTLSGPRAGINYIPKIMPDWNDTKSAQFIKPATYNSTTKKIETICTYRFHDHIEPSDDYCSDPHILGLFEAFPENWGLPLGHAVQTLVQYDPIKLFNSIFFKEFDLQPVWDDNRLYVRDPNDLKVKEVGRKVVLKSSKLQHGDFLIGKYQLLESKPKDDDVVGTLITENIEHHGTKICEAGVIMQAPYFLIEYNCDQISIYKAFSGAKNHFTGNKKLLDELFANNDKLRQGIEEKNREATRAKENEQLAIKERKRAEDALQSEKIARLAEKKATDDLLKQIAREETLIRAIAGGVAHEERNALTGPKYQIEHMNSYKNGKSIYDLYTHDMQNLMTNIKAFESEYQISKQEMGQKVVLFLKNQAKLMAVIESKNEIIAKGLERGLDISTRFKEFAENQNVPRGEDRVDICKLLNSYKSLLELQAEKKAVTYTVDCASEIFIKGNTSQIDSIIKNIVLNAFDAVVDSTEKKVHVTVTDQNEYLQITVKDTGMGILHEKVETIFDPFESTKPNTGYGLGLTEAQSMVKKYDGNIDVQSNPGETIFTVELKK